MKRIVLLTTLLLMMGCETGVKNKAVATKEAPSGIIDKVEGSSSTTYTSSYSKSTKSSSNKIFSKSAQPGYYLQVAVFAKSEPTKQFLAPLDASPFGYIVLTHYNKNYVLIGPYKSYNEAKAKVNTVKYTVHKKTFVVEVARP